MRNIFDSHAHYTLDAFDEDRAELLAALPSRGVCGVMLAATCAQDADAAADIAADYGLVYASAGVHPECSSYLPDGWLEEIAAVLRRPKVMAIGEIGLDYHYENTDREKQIAVFEAQLGLARDMKLPVIVHSRDACEDTVRILQKYRPEGVVHCFSGSAETAREILALGMYIGFTGVLTFRNARRAIEALAAVGASRLLLETDCPYMAPEPFRGRRSDSTMIEYTAAAAARVLDMDTQRLLDIVCENARKLYGTE